MVMAGTTLIVYVFSCRGTHCRNRCSTRCTDMHARTRTHTHGGKKFFSPSSTVELFIAEILYKRYTYLFFPPLTEDLIVRYYLLSFTGFTQ